MSMSWASRRAEVADVPRVASVLARAFVGDPMYTWALDRADPVEQERRLYHYFEALVGKVLLRHGLTFTTDGEVGAAVWAPPHHWRFRFIDEARVTPAVLRAFGSSVTRLLRIMVDFQRVHPREPHYYLLFLGTDPAQQKRGIGSALLQPMLARCDAEGLPAYLESSKESNLPFYRRHGFEAVQELALGDVRITTMRRPPR